MFAALKKEFGGSIWEWRKLPEREIEEWDYIRQCNQRLRNIKISEQQAQSLMRG